MKILNQKILDESLFKTILKNAPLVSIDLCLVYRNQILLGLRSNEPLKNCWFTPGGRIMKNESWQKCLIRVAESELGLLKINLEKFHHMGVWDHFYENSIFGDNISTHYVNLPYYTILNKKPELSIDFQHSGFQWFDIKDVAFNKKFNKYTNLYAKYLLDNQLS